MQNAESVLENEKLKFEIQTDHPISAKRPDLIITLQKRELADLWTLL